LLGFIQKPFDQFIHERFEAEYSLMTFQEFGIQPNFLKYKALSSLYRLMLDEYVNVKGFKDQHGRLHYKKHNRWHVYDLINSKHLKSIDLCFRFKNLCLMYVDGLLTVECSETSKAQCLCEDLLLDDFMRIMRELCHIKRENDVYVTNDLKVHRFGCFADPEIEGVDFIYDLVKGEFTSHEYMFRAEFLRRASLN
jgi:hypothetical protein